MRSGEGAAAAALVAFPVRGAASAAVGVVVLGWGSGMVGRFFGEQSGAGRRRRGEERLSGCVLQGRQAKRKKGVEGGATNDSSQGHMSII
jgi:hypothetical protein